VFCFNLVRPHHAFAIVCGRLGYESAPPPNRYAEAVRLFKEALTIRLYYPGGNRHPATAAIYLSLGTCSLKQGGHTLPWFELAIPFIARRGPVPLYHSLACLLIPDLTA